MDFFLVGMRTNKTTEGERGGRIDIFGEKGHSYMESPQIRNLCLDSDHSDLRTVLHLIHPSLSISSLPSPP